MEVAKEVKDNYVNCRNWIATLVANFVRDELKTSKVKMESWNGTFNF